MTQDITQTQQTAADRIGTYDLRRVESVVEAREEIAREAAYCRRAQSWCPSSTRSGWYGELEELVAAIDAVEYVLDEDGDATDEMTPRSAVDVLTALDAAEEEADRLARIVAVHRAEERAEQIRDHVKTLAEIDVDGDVRDILDALQEWEDALHELCEDDRDDGRDGARVERDGSRITVTGWARTRVVRADSGAVVSASDAAEEIEVDVDVDSSEASAA